MTTLPTQEAWGSETTGVAASRVYGSPLMNHLYRRPDRSVATRSKCAGAHEK